MSFFFIHYWGQIFGKKFRGGVFGEELFGENLLRNIFWRKGKNLQGRLLGKNSSFVQKQGDMLPVFL